MITSYAFTYYRRGKKNLITRVKRSFPFSFFGFNERTKTYFKRRHVINALELDAGPRIGRLKSIFKRAAVIAR